MKKTMIILFIMVAIVALSVIRAESHNIQFSDWKPKSIYRCGGVGK